jgi:hypothetical protein
MDDRRIDIAAIALLAAVDGERAELLIARAPGQLSSRAIVSS